MAVALKMLLEFSPRLCQVHVSDVDSDGAHGRVGILAKWAYQMVSRQIPSTCPLIIESVVPAEAMSTELAAVAEAFGRSWGEGETAVSSRH